MVFRGMLVLLAALACKGEPKRSYCEALCDWGVACQATERDIDQEAALEACLDLTRASDASCENAESGKIDPASAKALDLCVDAIDQKASEGACDGWVGRIDDLKTATVPAECVSQGDDAVKTFDDARTSTQESGEELCTRFTDTLCRRMSDCLLGDVEVPQAAVDALGGTPFELCVQRLEPVLTNDCIQSGRYDPEENLDDVNTARQSARECLRDIDSVPCSAFISSPQDMPPECTGSFTTTEQLTAVGEALLGVVADYQDYLQ